MSKMTIPQVRERLRDLAVLHGLPELAALADQMHRRKHARKAPVKSKTVTPALEAAIRAHAKAHPKASQQEIAVFFGVNTGRVSEALFGKR